MSPTSTRPAPGTRRSAREASEEPPTAADGGGAEEAGSKGPTTSSTSPSGAPSRSRAAARPVPTSAGTVWKVLAVLGLLGTVGFGIAWRTAQSGAVTEDGLSPQVVEMRTSARDFAIALTNFDASTIDADFDRIVDAATGQFAEEADRFYDEQIRADLRDAQASSQSEIRDLYVQGFDGDSGSVFVVVDQTVVNNLSPQPVTDTLRVELGMARVDGEWKVRTVEVLDAPAGSQLDGSGLADEETTTTTAGG